MSAGSGHGVSTPKSGLSSTYAPANSGAAARVPALPRVTWASTLQSGHGWTNVAAGALTDDTTDYVLGTQSLKVSTAAAQKTGLALDMTDKMLVIWLRVNSIASSTQIIVYFGQTSAFTAFKTWNIRLGSVVNPRVPTGEWVRVTLPWDSHDSITGSPTRNSMDAIRVRTLSGDGDFNLQAVGTVPEGAQTGCVSFTFDDGYLSDLTAARILGARGIAATTYAIPANVGGSGFMTAAQIRTLHATYGWDVEMHGAGPNYTTFSADALRAEWTASRRWFAENGLGRGEHMAYPGGYTDPAVVSVAREFFATARTIDRGVQLETWPPPEPYYLRAISAISSHSGGVSVATVQTAIDRAVASGQWLILVFHRIVPTTTTSTMDCTEADLATIANYAISAGADIRTVAERVA